MKYIEEVKEDIRQYIKDEVDLDRYGDREEAEADIYEQLWICDSVTGNASGSYTFNRYAAMEKVLADMDTVVEALTEFCVEDSEIAKHFLQEDWEWFDVTARCYELGSALYEVMNELYK